MGIFGSIGRGLKKLAPVGGFILGNALLPGIGGVIGGGLGGAIANSGKGKSVGDVALGGLGGAAGAYGANKLGGLGGIGSKLGGLKLSPAEIAQLGISGLGVVQGAQKAGKADAINAGLLAKLDAQAAAQAKAREMAMARLGQPAPVRPNLSRLTQSANPFARMA